VVIDSVYRVRAEHVARRQDKKGRRFLNAVARAAHDPLPGLDDLDASRGIVEGTGTLVQAGQVIDRGFFFEPGESSTREFILYVPAGSYDLLDLSAELSIAAHRILNLDQGPAFGPKRQEHTYGYAKYVLLNTRWDIQETSWVRRLIRGDNVLWSRWVVNGPMTSPLPVVFTYVDKKGAAWDPWAGGNTPRRIIHLSSEYSVLLTHTHAELSLFPGAAGG
jgi:hypothetical protein